MAAAYTPKTVRELKQHVAEILGFEVEELGDTQLCRVLKINPSRYKAWAAKHDGLIAPVARPEIRKALVRLRAEQEESPEAPVDDLALEATSPATMENSHSYVARGFFLTGEQFVKLEPDIQRHVLRLVERGQLKDLEEEPE